jgi:hypothetical protein
MGNREMYGKDEPKEGKGPADKELIGCVQGVQGDENDILAEQIDQAYEKEKYKRALGDGWKEYDIPAIKVAVGGVTGTFDSDGKNGTGE